MKEIKAKKQSLAALLANSKITTSRSEARRMIAQGGIKINDKRVVEDIEIEENIELQVGKKEKIKIEIE